MSNSEDALRQIITLQLWQEHTRLPVLLSQQSLNKTISILVDDASLNSILPTAKSVRQYLNKTLTGIMDQFQIFAPSTNLDSLSVEGIIGRYLIEGKPELADEDNFILLQTLKEVIVTALPSDITQMEAAEQKEIISTAIKQLLSQMENVLQTSMVVHFDN